MKHTTKMIIAVICAVMITAPAVFAAASVSAQDITPTPKNHCPPEFPIHWDAGNEPQCFTGQLDIDVNALPVGGQIRAESEDGTCSFIRREAGVRQVSIHSCNTGGGGGSSGPSTGAIVGIGVAVGVGVFVMSEMADKHGLLPRGFTPDFRFAMNDVKRPAVYIGNVYPLSDNQTLRFGISEVLNDDGDDFTIAAEWRLSL